MLDLLEVSNLKETKKNDLHDGEIGEFLLFVLRVYGSHTVSVRLFHKEYVACSKENLLIS